MRAGIAETMLAVALLPRNDLERLASATGAAALVVGALAAIGGAWAFVRYPGTVPVVVLVAAPFRLPVDLGSQHAFLLLPLYVVLAAASLALMYRVVQGEILRADSRLACGAGRGAHRLGVVLAPLGARPRAGLDRLLFFVFPFAALLAVVARAPYAVWLPRALAVTLVGLAAVFAAVGLYQAWSHTLVFAQDLRVANAYTTYFRVTSLFKDPSIYGRQLVLAISLLVALLWLARVRLAVAIPLVCLLFAGLYFSYSQSSIVVLFVTVLALDCCPGRPPQPQHGARRRCRGRGRRNHNGGRVRQR